MGKRGQTSVEVLVIMAIGIVILSSFVGFAAQQLKLVQEQKAVKTAEVSLQKIVNAANDVYVQGKGATRNVEIIWPDGIESAYSLIEDKTIQIRTYNRTIYATSIPTLVGSLPTGAGYHVIRIRAFDGFVTVGEVSLSATPSTVFAPMDRNDSSSHTIVIHNSGADANLVFTTDWNYEDIDLNLSTTATTLTSGSNYTLDVNFYSGLTATGSYPGKLWVQGTYSNKVETLLVPLTAAVSLNSETDLTVYPTSVSMSTYQSDSNSVQIQVCNTGSATLKTITFTPSTGDAGDWVQGISTIDEIDPLTCEPVTLTLKPDTSTSIGSYSGSLFLSDFSGANTYALPITFTVKGMNGIFLWDWTNAVKSTNGIVDFTLSNLGNVPIGVSQVAISDWWSCDSQDSNLTLIKFNDSTVFSGTSSDGNWINLTDFNIPILTALSGNLLNFNGTINDENESFVAQVYFTDGTIYTSGTYGSNCVDTTPPATVNDLRAIMGPNAQSIKLTFTYPGDDGNTGLVRSMDLRYSTSSALSSDSAFESAGISYPYTGPFNIGGTAGSILIDDLNVGYGYYFALKFTDSSDNESALSNNTVARPWNSFEHSSSDFNFANMPYSVPLVSTGDVNKFTLEGVRVDTGSPNNIVICIVDSDRDGAWTSRFDFNSTSLTRIRIWYPSSCTSAPTGSAQYDQNKSLPYSNTFNLLASGLINSQYRYNGNNVTMNTPNYFYVTQVQNMLDFNFTIDKADAQVIGGGFGGP